MKREKCRVCGKSLALTPSGRIPRHVPVLVVDHEERMRTGDVY